MSIEEQRGSTKLAIKAGSWYVISTFLLRAIAFITIPIFTRIMTKGDYGEFLNYANWQTILLIITSAEIYNTVPRAYYDYKNKFDEYISSILVLNTILTFSVYLIFIFSSKWIYNIVSIPPRFVHVMFFTLLCSSYKTIFLSRERTLYKYKTVALVSAMDTVIPTIIAVVLVAYSASNFKLSARIYGYYIPSASIGLILALIMFSKARINNIEHYKYALKLSLPLLVNYLTINLLSSTNIIIAKNIMGADSGATIGIATSIVHIVSLLFQALSGALTTWLMDNLNSDNLIKIRKELIFFVMGLAVISIGVILFTPEVVMILGGNKYKDTISLVPGLILGMFIQSLVTIFTIILTYSKRVTVSGVIIGTIGVLSIVLKVTFLPRLGMIALPLVNILAGAVLFVAYYILVWRVGFKNTIDITKFTLLITVVAIFALISNYLFMHNYIRYGISLCGIVVSIFILIKYKNRILPILGRKGV